VLNSEREDVRDAAVAELEVQGALFDAMGLPPESVVVIHIGGAAGGTGRAADRFAAGFELLSERTAGRIVIENDDRTFSLSDALPIAARTGAPVVWDALHHRCNDPEGMGEAEALGLALATWSQGVTPKIHYSSPRLDVGERKRKVGRRIERTPALPDLRNHADLVDPMAFEPFLRSVLAGSDVDVMLEAKAKDLALIRLREQLGARGLPWEHGHLTAP
jgi:UV DNA damage endonuclease